MSDPEFETFLARLYTDAEFRKAFLTGRSGVAARAGLSGQQIESLVAMDAEGLALAAQGFETKRHKKTKNSDKANSKSL